MSDGSAPPTIRSLHVVAEHVLGAGLYAATGHIGLQVTPGGFGTPRSAVDDLGGRFAVAHGMLVLDRPGGARQEAPITTVAAAADFFDVAPGMPASVYQPSNRLVLDEVLPVNHGIAERIGAWLSLGDEALADFAAEHPDLEPTGRTLWPEHFDLGLAMGEVNYGVSPGDAAHAEPYLYVGPWTPRTGPFWNEPFGASVPAGEIATVGAALAFFEEGRRLAAANRSDAE